GLGLRLGRSGASGGDGSLLGRLGRGRGGLASERLQERELQRGRIAVQDDTDVDLDHGRFLLLGGGDRFGVAVPTVAAPRLRDPRALGIVYSTSSGSTRAKTA